jgi:hypothetical protein
VPDIHEILHLSARAPADGRMPYKTSVEGLVLYSDEKPILIDGSAVPPDAALIIAKVIAKDSDLLRKRDTTADSDMNILDYSRYVLTQIIRLLSGDAQPALTMPAFGQALAIFTRIHTATADPSPENLDMLFRKLKDVAHGTAKDPRFEPYRTYTNGTRDTPMPIDAPHKGEDMFLDAAHLAFTTLQTALPAE